MAQATSDLNIPRERRIIIYDTLYYMWSAPGTYSLEGEDTQNFAVERGLPLQVCGDAECDSLIRSCNEIGVDVMFDIYRAESLNDFA
jgi:hypothetical protein